MKTLLYTAGTYGSLSTPPVRTGRTGPDFLPVRPGAKKDQKRRPYVRAGRTGRTSGPDVRVVCTVIQITMAVFAWS